MKSTELRQRVVSINEVRNALIGDLVQSAECLSKYWINAGKLSNIRENDEVKDIIREAGLYRARLDGKVVYVGVATRANAGGMRVRLKDYVKESRCRCTSARKMHQYMRKIEIDLLPLGDYEMGALAAKALEGWFIRKHRHTVWNKRSLADCAEEEWDDYLKRS